MNQWAELLIRVAATAVGATVAIAIMLAAHWLSCRVTARRCPRCGSKWRTELVGEWDAEQWQCRRCGKYWEHRPCRHA